MEKIGLQAVWNNADFLRGQSEYINKVNQATQATQQAAGAMSGGGGIGAAAIFVGSALGNLASSAIQSAISGLSGLASSAIDAVSSFQKLEVGLQSLAAREMVSVGMADNVSEALDAAVPRANAMLEALKEVSLASPFEYQDIAKIYSLSIAFGQGSKTAMELTKAITDLAAVSPLASGQLLERIAYNFNQMSLTGKITARDIRDLAMAGVNFSQVLRDELGMSVEQANEALKSGEITMRDVTQAFINYAEKGFGGAAERLATQTLPGLISSFKDLAFFASQQVFGPATQVVTEFLGKIYEYGKALLDSGVLMRIGATLKVLAEMAINFLSRVFGIQAPIQTSLRSINDAVSDSTKQIADTITQQAEAVKEKIAPSFQGIGLDTATAWLSGFSKADFSILDTIMSPLSGLSNYMAKQLGLSSAEASAGFANLFADITKSISSGDLQGAFGRIIAQFGSAGQTIVNLAKANMQVADSTKAVQEAEKRLADARKARDVSEAKANRLVREYNRLLRDGADANSEMMKAKEKEIQSAYAEVEANDKTIEAAEDDLEAKKEAEKQAKEQMQVQKDLVNALMQFAQAQSSAMADAQAAASDTAEEMENLGQISSEDIFQGINESANKFAEMEQNVRDRLNEIVEALQTKFGPAWNSIRNIVSGTYDWLKIETGNLVNYLISWWQEHNESVITVFTYLRDKITEIVSTFFSWDVIQQNWENTKQILANIGETIGNFFDILAAIIEGRWSDVWVEVGNILRLALDSLWLLLENQINWWKHVFTSVLGEDLMKAVDEFWNTQFPVVLKNMREKIEDAGNVLKSTLSNAFDTVKSRLAELQDFFSDAFNNIRSTISDLWHFIFDFVNVPISYLQEGFNIIGDAIAFAVAYFDWLRDKISEIWHFIYDFINNPIAALWGALSSIFGWFSGSPTSSPSGTTSQSIPSSAFSPSISQVAPSSSTPTVVINVGNVNNGMDLSTLTSVITNTVNGLIAI